MAAAAGDPVWDYPHMNVAGYRVAHYRAPTPPTVPEGRRVDTAEVAKLVAQGDAVLVDVMPALLRDTGAGLSWIVLEERQHIPGSVWLPNVGLGQPEPEVVDWFERNLQQLTDGDQDRPLLFYCVSDCWMAWNAVRRAYRLGFRNLLWYAEGSDGWAAAGNETVAASPRPWLCRGG
ncbi:rhodanese-like domain-containing protein [Alkalilimnicola ehrlichii]|uniref:rhodanese-like domain-containing protein n=1 Tax=Alkalilimnicola ehrlichii TaxID=351052 RepID=UPI001C6E4E42|nr:rhodanese-like domain-containing protein [Alkalilimnicola ehrlichii]